MYTQYCHLWSVRLCTLFLHYLKKARISMKIKSIYIKYVFWFFLQVCPKLFSLYVELSEIFFKIYIGCRVQWLLLLSDFNKNLFLYLLRQNLKKILKYWISWKPCQWEPSRPTRTDGRTNGKTYTTKPIEASGNFANMTIKIKYRQWKFVTMHEWELNACGIWLRNLKERERDYFNLLARELFV